MLGWLTRWTGRKELAEVRAELLAHKASQIEALLSGGPTSSLSETPMMGVAREEERHLGIGWVYAAVSAIAQRIAAQPIRVGRRTKKPRPKRAVNRKNAPLWIKELADGLEVVTSHRILDALAKPNRLMPAWSLIWNTVASLEVTGRAFWLHTGAGEGDEDGSIWPIPSSWVEPLHNKGLFAEYRIWPRNSPNPAPVIVPGEMMIRFYLPDAANPIRGSLSPAQTQARAVVTDEAIQESQRKTFENGLYPGMALVVGRHPDIAGIPGQRPILSKEQRGQLIASLKKAYRGAWNAGEPIILDGLIEDIKKLTHTAAEMDYLQSGRSTKERIFQGLGVNPIVRGEITDVNRAQAAVAESIFCSSTINPKMELLGQWMTMELPPRFDDPDVVVWMEPARADDPEKTRAEMDQLAKYGAVTRNELRAAYSHPPLPDGKGGDDLIPMATRQSAPETEGGGGSKSHRDFRRKQLRLKRLEAAKDLWLRSHGAGQTEFRDSLKAFFRGMTAKIVDALRQHPDLPADALFRPSEWVAPLKAVARDGMEKLAYAGAVNELGQAEKRFLPTTKAPTEGRLESGADLRGKLPFDVRRAIDFFLDDTMEQEWWADLPESVKKDLAKSLQDGVDAGEAGPKTADRVEKVLTEGGDERAERVVRTELTGGLNAGHQASREYLEKLGVVNGKEWLAIEDDDTRESHLEANGQKVGVTESFTVGGEECDYPGDYSLSPEERVRCRCTAVSVLADDGEEVEEVDGDKNWSQIIYSKLSLKGRGDNLTWLKPDLTTGKNEKEINRSVKGLAKYGVKIDPDELRAKLKAGKMIDLDESIWKTIVNTDSLETEKLQDILDIVHEQGKKLRGVLEEFFTDKVRAPILVEMPDGDYFLVNGNTRLMVCRVFKFKPKAWCGDL